MMMKRMMTTIMIMMTIVIIIKKVEDIHGEPVDNPRLWRHDDMMMIWWWYDDHHHNNLMIISSLYKRLKTSTGSQLTTQDLEWWRLSVSLSSPLSFFSGDDDYNDYDDDDNNDDVDDFNDDNDNHIDTDNDYIELPGWLALQIRRNSWRVEWTSLTVWWNYSKVNICDQNCNHLDYLWSKLQCFNCNWSKLQLF